MANSLLWYKDAIFYELHVKSFCDGNGDGIGDFKGLMSKLPYLVRLGVDVIWLLPFYPSPHKDDGYDIADYKGVHPDYGTLDDFKHFLKAAHAEGLKVITELVLNHTSDQHHWFQKSRRAKPGSAARNWYVWSDSPEKYHGTRIIFQDFEISNWTRDPVAKAYFWHRFYSHQPDLNFDNPAVRKAMLQVLDFWLDLGVDGLRLDAVPYLFEREGTSCENLPETYDYLRELRKHVDEKYPDRMLLAEANQWPEDAVAYFGTGDICHMAFHFPLMPRMYMAIEMESRHPIVDILEQTPPIPDSAQWALFLRNHDELTLEMVTDEERDYMYRMYVQDPRARLNVGIRRRLAPLLDNDRRKVELMNVLLMTLPGSPVIYYGDEIGMGDNYLLGDRSGVRTPMQWNADRNAGFSQAKPQQIFLPLVLDSEYAYPALNVENQESRQSSLLWWMRQLIAVRRGNTCLGRGRMEFVRCKNAKVFGFLRRHGDDVTLVAVNLSRHYQSATFDLEEFSGRIPEDVFSRNELTPIGTPGYTMHFMPYGYYVLQLQPAQEKEQVAESQLPRLEAPSWERLFESKATRRQLEQNILPPYMKRQRWYGGKARKLLHATILDWIPFPNLVNAPAILLVEAGYQDGEPEVYILPLSFAPQEPDQSGYEMPKGTLAWIKAGSKEGALFEAVFSPRFSRELLRILLGHHRIKGVHGRLFPHSKGLHALVQKLGLDVDTLSPRPLGEEQSNTSILYGNDLLLKLYRRSEAGLHPDVEMSRHLTETARFQHTPAYYGHLEYQTQDGRGIVLGLLQRFIQNQGDAWRFSLDLLGRFYDRVASETTKETKVPEGHASFLGEGCETPSEALAALLSAEEQDMVHLLGVRTAEMHLALADQRNDQAFAPEEVTTLSQRATFQSMRNQTVEELRVLRTALASLPEDVQAEAKAVLAAQDRIVEKMKVLVGRPLKAKKIRIHGDYHLGQVLYTGTDFVIFDFEGEPARPLSERRIKRIPVRDVAGMLRSFHYAVHSALLSGRVLPQDVPRLTPWAELWYQQMCCWYLHAYRQVMAGHGIMPDGVEDFGALLTPYLLEKATYELGYELNNRPDWLHIPLRGILYLCGA